MPKKFDFLISEVSTATHKDCLSPTAAMAELSDLLQAVTQFKVLARTNEFKALASAIKTLPMNGLHSRQLALKRLHQDLNAMSHCRPELLIGAFTCLSRRYFIFNEMDRILFIKGTYSDALVFDVAAIYVVLSTQEVLPQNAFTKLASKEYEFSFEAEARTHWLEIMAIIADEYFASLFTQLPEEVRIAFYKHWPIEADSPNGLWDKREDMVKQTIFYIEEVFALKLGNMYKRNLLVKMRDFPKAVVHRGLAGLENLINKLNENNDAIPRASAIKYLKNRVNLLFKQHNNFSAIHAVVLVEYEQFIDFEKKVKDFKSVLDTYNGPRCMVAINSAVDDSYFTYAKNGDTRHALAYLTREVSQVRNIIHREQKPKPTGWFIMFGFPNPLISLLDKALLAVNDKVVLAANDEVSHESSFHKVRLLRI